MTKGDSTVTALFKVLSPINKRSGQPFSLRVTGDSTFLQAHIRDTDKKEIGQVTPRSAVTCHLGREKAHLVGKKQGDSTRSSGVTPAVTRTAVSPCR